MFFLSAQELSKRFITELNLAGFASHEKIFFSFPNTGKEVLHKVPQAIFDFLLLLMSGLLSDPAVDSFQVEWMQYPEEQDSPELSVGIRLTLKNEVSHFNFRQFTKRHSIKRHLDRIKGKVNSLEETSIIFLFPRARKENESRKPLYMEKLLAEVGDPELCRELIEGFISHTGRLLQELGEKLILRDSAGVYQIAHSLKGSALNILAEGLQSAAAELEIQARSGILEKGGEYLEKIKAEYAAITQYFKKEYHEKKDSIC
jgi:HPt (histidine-containing phosphotransfer) domain-containing protein